MFIAPRARSFLFLVHAGAYVVTPEIHLSLHYNLYNNK